MTAVLRAAVADLARSTLPNAAHVSDAPAAWVATFEQWLAGTLTDDALRTIEAERFMAERDIIGPMRSKRATLLRRLFSACWRIARVAVHPHRHRADGWGAETLWCMGEAMGGGEDGQARAREIYREAMERYDAMSASMATATTAQSIRASTAQPTTSESNAGSSAGSSGNGVRQGLT